MIHKHYVKIDKSGPAFKLHWGGGVKQGNPLSPNLFNTLMEHNIFRKLDWTNKDIKMDEKFKPFKICRRHCNNEWG